MSGLKKTPLYNAHIDSGGKMVDFSGWSLPIHYGSQITEHEAVRNNAGMFDVSHMLVSDYEGTDVKKWLEYLIANDINKLTVVGKALYTTILNEKGGVIDDLIVYRLNESETKYRIVSNAATREKDLSHFEKTSQNLDVQITSRYDLAILAVQGPNAINLVKKIKPDWSTEIDKLKPFQAAEFFGNYFVAKTGYTGESGVEVILPLEEINDLFEQLKSVGVVPCGLGARDTLRLEAGMNLYGHDMDDDVSPLEAGLAWTVSLTEKRDFIGKQALLSLKESGVNLKQVGLFLTSRGVLRDGMTVEIPEYGEGIITSGSFSPTLKQSIALARVPVNTKDKVLVSIRGTLTEVRVVKIPFIRNGKKQFD